MKPLYKINLTVYDAKQWHDSDVAAYYGHTQKVQLDVIDTKAFGTNINLLGDYLTDTFLRGFAEEFLGPRAAHYHVYSMVVTAEIFRNDTDEKIYDTWFYFNFPYLKSLGTRETGRELGSLLDLFDRSKGE